MVRLTGVESLASEICLRKRRIEVRGIVLKNGHPDSHAVFVIDFKTEPLNPSDELDSNVEVTGDPLEAACGAWHVCGLAKLDIPRKSRAVDRSVDRLVRLFWFISSPNANPACHP